MQQMTLYFDGSCWPNPGGTAAYGFALYKGPEKEADGHGVIGTGPEYSNNFAEFHSLYQGLHELSSRLFATVGGLEFKLNTHVTIKGDSQLVINILNKKFKANPDKLYWPEWVKCAALIRNLRMHGVHFTAIWVPREQNIECDDLSKAHLSES